MERKKVLIVIPKFVLAGAETMCKNLILAINKSKFNPIVVSLYNYASPIVKELEENIEVLFLNKKSGFDFSIIFKLRKIIKLNNIQVIHTHLHVLEYVVFATGFNKKIKIIHTIHHLPSKDSIFIRLFHMFSYNILKVVPVAISEQIKKDTIYANKVKESKVKIIYNGIDLSSCKQKRSYAKFEKILHIGRFVEVKNHWFLIDLFKQIQTKIAKNNLDLYLVGDGLLFNEINNYIISEKLNNKIHLVGNLSNCYDILNKSDLFILPSKYEGMPMTIIEAMATGVPVIASNVGGIPDMIENGVDGFIANNKEEFIDYILQLNNSEELRRSIGKNAIKKSAIFSSKIMAEKYEELYF